MPETSTGTFVHQVSAFLSKILTHPSTSKTEVQALRTVARTLSLWHKATKAADPHKMLHSLEDGGVFALYLAKQNAGILISRSTASTDDALVSAFQVGLPGAVSYQGERQAVFPEPAVHVPFARAKTASFGKQLTALRDCGICEAQAKSCKAGRNLSEVLQHLSHSPCRQVLPFAGTRASRCKICYGVVGCCPGRSRYARQQRAACEKETSR